MTELSAELDPPFDVLEPVECQGPIVFNSPHSGHVYPRAFLVATRLDLPTLRRSEDSFVDELFASSCGPRAMSGWCGAGTRSCAHIFRAVTST